MRKYNSLKLIYNVMKCFTVVVISILFWGGLLTNISKAQDDDCCPEE